MKTTKGIVALMGVLGFCTVSAQEITPLTPVVPVVAAQDHNATFGLKVTGPCKVTGMTLDVSGTTDAKDIERLEVYYSTQAGKPDFVKMKRYGTVTLKSKSSILKKLDLADETYYFWVSIRVKDSTPLTHQFTAKISDVTFSEAGVKKIDAAAPVQRMGVSVRDTGDDECKGYRIPGIATSKKGTLLAIYDVRYDSARDLQGHMDIGLSRSTDGGKSWGRMKNIIDMGTFGGLPEKFNGVSDASVLVDDKTGHIFVAGCWMHGVNGKDGKWIEGLTDKDNQWTHQWHKTGSMPGLDPEGTSQFMMVKSTNDGKTWSKPVNLTEKLKDPKWHLFAPAPGAGITMSDGTLVMPTQGRDENSVPFSNFIYSKDGGKTWNVSNFAKSNTTECQIAELSDGSLMLNMRDNRNYHAQDISESGRSVCVTKDMGQTWAEHATSRKALPEPVCCAGLLKHTFKNPVKGLPKSILVFSNPPNKTKKGGRHHMTLKVSLDDGKTWPEEYHLLLDTFGGAYSCLTSVDDEHIGILYEGSRARIFYQKIAIKDVLNLK